MTVIDRIVYLTAVVNQQMQANQQEQMFTQNVNKNTTSYTVIRYVIGFNFILSKNKN